MIENYMPINRCSDKENMVCIHNGVLLSHKDEKFESFVGK